MSRRESEWPTWVYLVALLAAAAYFVLLWRSNSRCEARGGTYLIHEMKCVRLERIR